MLNKYKVGKHFAFEIRERHFDFHLQEEQIAAEAALDGICVYVIRTCVPKQQMSAADTVRNYMALAQVELRLPLAQDGRSEGAPHHSRPRGDSVRGRKPAV